MKRGFFCQHPIFLPTHISVPFRRQCKNQQLSRATDNNKTTNAMFWQWSIPKGLFPNILSPSLPTSLPLTGDALSGDIQYLEFIFLWKTELCLWIIRFLLDLYQTKAGWSSRYHCPPPKMSLFPSEVPHIYWNNLRLHQKAIMLANTKLFKWFPVYKYFMSEIDFQMKCT